jgi:hypothetical protein
MTCQIELPDITSEEAATPSAEPALGFGASPESRVSVGRSDVLAVTADDVVADPQLAAHLRDTTSRALVRITFRMSLWPADGERFTGALFTVRLLSEDAPPEAQPIARLFVPERLTAGRITAQDGISLALTGGVPGTANANVSASSQTTSELERYYVYSLGDGEADPAWRYQTTQSMPALEGAYTMGLVAEVASDFSAEAQLDVRATVRRLLRSTEIRWTPTDNVQRFPIFSPPPTP